METEQDKILGRIKGIIFNALDKISAVCFHFGHTMKQTEITIKYYRYVLDRFKWLSDKETELSQLVKTKYNKCLDVLYNHAYAEAKDNNGMVKLSTIDKTIKDMKESIEKELNR